MYILTIYLVITLLITISHLKDLQAFKIIKTQIISSKINNKQQIINKLKEMLMYNH